MRSYAVICLLASLAAVAHAAVDTKQIGERLALCKRSSPDFDSCMADRLQVLLPELARTGIPELDLPGADPGVIPEMLIQYKNGNLTADLLIKNSRSWGVKDAKIHSVRSKINDPKDFHIEVDFTIPHVYTEGDYKVNAKLLLPMKTKGYYNISMTDVTGTWDVSGEHFLKNGEDYVRITHFSMLPEVGDMKVYATNLFPGNEELSKAALNFSNQYWRFIYMELLPVTNEAWGMVGRNELNKMFLRMPFNQIFPEE